jgi:hypothetical protein
MFYGIVCTKLAAAGPVGEVSWSRPTAEPSVDTIEQHYGKWLSDDIGRWLDHVTAKPVSDGAVAAQIP